MHTFNTPRVVLEPLVVAHADAMFELLRDPAIYAYENAPPPSLAGLRQRYALLATRRSPDGTEQWLNWVVRLRDEAAPDASPGACIGYVQATLYPGGDAAVAYVFGSAWWGRGLASEAVAAMLDALARDYAVRHLYAVYKAANGRSQRLLVRLGFGTVPPDRHAPLMPDADERLLMRAACTGHPIET